MRAAFERPTLAVAVAVISSARAYGRGAGGAVSDRASAPLVAETVSAVGLPAVRVGDMEVRAAGWRGRPERSSPSRASSLWLAGLWIGEARGLRESALRWSGALSDGWRGRPRTRVLWRVPSPGQLYVG